jgi:hypothetical protein
VPTNPLIELLRLCPVPLVEVHAEMRRGGSTVSLAALQSWSAGRNWPAPRNLAHLSEALVRLGEGTANLGRLALKLERPRSLQGGAWHPGGPGRPPRSSS